MSSLFRTTEATSSGTHDSSIVLARPIAHTVLVVFFAGIAICIVMFLFGFSVTRKTHVLGVLLPKGGLLHIQSPQSGTILDARIREGQSVKAGDILFVVSSDRSSLGQGSAGSAASRLIDTRLQSIRRDQEQQRLQSDARVSALRVRAQDLIGELGKIEQQVELQHRRIVLASDAFKRDGELRAANFISSATAQQHEADLLDQQQRLADLERAKAAVARDMTAVGAEIVNAEIQARRDQESAGRTVAELQQELAENEVRREVLVRAPQDGIASAVVAVVGATISPGQTLASLLPANSPLEAEVYAPSRAVGFLKPGMKVLLRYQAYPYQKFGQFPGSIREVSGTPISADETGTAAPPTSSAEPVYRIRVSLDRQTALVYGENRPLTPGMALEASVLLERRRLYEWILEPLYSIYGRV